MHLFFLRDPLSDFDWNTVNTNNLVDILISIIITTTTISYYPDMI